MRGWFHWMLLLGALGSTVAVGATLLLDRGPDPVLEARRALQEFGIVWRGNLTAMSSSTRVSVVPAEDGTSAVDLVTQPDTTPFDSRDNTQGARLRIGRKTSLDLIGQTVVVELDVSRDEESAAPHVMAVAYATRSHGGSGWAEIPLRPGRDRYSVAIQVPNYPSGQADSVDLLAVVGDVLGTGQRIRLHGVLLRRLDD